MRMGIMQPYFFPYIGYFHLIHAVDSFVFLDDVQYVKKSWVNRNRLMINNAPNFFTVPVKKAHQSTLIKDIQVSPAEFEHWKRKFSLTLMTFYKNAPYFLEGMSIVEEVLSKKTLSIAELAMESVRVCSAHLKLTSLFCVSSVHYPNTNQKKDDRIINICTQNGVNVYINLPGGRGLYAPEVFASHGLKLRFIHSTMLAYALEEGKMRENLSILDPIMCCGLTKTRDLFLKQYDVVC